MLPFPRTKRFIIALLAQVTLCLAFAPVIASGAQPPRQESSQNDKPAPGGPSIQAFDAANVRPEEEANAERKTGKTSGSLDPFFKRRGRRVALPSSETTASEIVGQTFLSAAFCGTGFQPVDCELHRQDACATDSNPHSIHLWWGRHSCLPLSLSSGHILVTRADSNPFGRTGMSSTHGFDGRQECLPHVESRQECLLHHIASPHAWIQWQTGVSAPPLLSYFVGAEWALPGYAPIGQSIQPTGPPAAFL